MGERGALSEQRNGHGVGKPRVAMRFRVATEREKTSSTMSASPSLTPAKPLSSSWPLPAWMVSGPVGAVQPVVARSARDEPRRSRIRRSRFTQLWGYTILAPACVARRGSAKAGRSCDSGPVWTSDRGPRNANKRRRNVRGLLLDIARIRVDPPVIQVKCKPHFSARAQAAAEPGKQENSAAGSPRHRWRWEGIKSL
jgi:hypothetical protein